MPKLYLFLLLSLFLVNTGLGQDRVVLLPSKDNTLFEDTTGTLSNGAGGYLFSGNTRLNERRRALIAFDLNEVSGMAIDSVGLTLTLSRSISGAAPIILHRIARDWGESSSIAEGNEGKGIAAEAGDATWLYAFFDSTKWDGIGGDFLPDTSALKYVEDEGTYTWTSREMLDDVRHWIENPAENFGWILVGNETTTITTKRFNSREHADSTTHPILELYLSTRTNTELPETSSGAQLLGNYPNPFREETSILIELDQPSIIKALIFDMLGREVLTVAEQQYSGIARINIGGQHLGPGAYIYRINVEHATQKEVLSGIVVKLE